MTSVLSTKILLPNQKELLLNSGLQLVEYDAIKIDFISFESPKQIPYALVSSKNAVKALLQKRIEVENYYCVGDKTRALLEKNDQNVMKSAKNGQELGGFIQKTHKDGPIFFFCGNRRREELPSALRAAHIPYEEVVTYQTQLNPKKFERSFDAVLFFSPSGVESFLKVNNLNNSWAICIGETTAEPLRSIHKKIAVANTPTVESVIAKTVKTVSTHD